MPVLVYTCTLAHIYTHTHTQSHIRVHTYIYISTFTQTVDSNNQEITEKLLNILLEGMLPHGPDTTPSPLPLQALNTLTMHAKIR